ncbi:MAG: hypothetical protein ABT01_05235 [Clostridium sp. SCN 57-10]|nr:MAG: hypothetical protein ABT01_05235 [Clostridium sp. SCN 57-10]
MISLIKADDTWVLWTIIILFATISIYLEQNFKWAERISGPVIGLILAIAAVNARVIPFESPVYDTVWSYCIPLSVAMLLFRADLKKIFKDTGKLLICFCISAVGTLIGAFVAYFAMNGLIPELDKMAGVLTGSYIGGGVNLFAIASSTNMSQTMLSAEVVADNFVMAIAFFILLWIPSSVFFKKHYAHPFQDKVEARSAKSEGKTLAAGYWGRKEISLIDLAVTISVAFVIVTISTKLAAFLKGSVSAEWAKILIGNQFVMLTIFAVAASTLFPKFFANLRGAQEIGTFLIYIFFVVIGCPADLWQVIRNAPLLFVFCGIMAGINILFTIGVGKLAKLNIEELAVASNANLGGPSTAAAMCVAKGYDELVVPAILVGLFGYMIGTPLGLMVYNILAK